MCFLCTAIVIEPPNNVSVCNGDAVVFTCAVDRNGTNITRDDMKWQQIRAGGNISTLSTSPSGVPFNITTTISGDVLNSTLMIIGGTYHTVLGTSLYRCVVPVSDLMSRNASIHASPGAGSLIV